MYNSVPFFPRCIFLIIFPFYLAWKGKKCFILTLNKNDFVTLEALRKFPFLGQF